MIFIDYLTPKVLIADKGKKIRDKRDVPTEEHIPYYFKILFIEGDNVDLNSYIEENE